MTNSNTIRPNEDGPHPEAVEAILDTLLLAIIRGHQRDSEGWAEERKRLLAAKKALFDIDPPKGPPTHHDIPELLHMADTYLKERGQPSLGEGYMPEWPGSGGDNNTSETQLAVAAIRERKSRDMDYAPHHEAEKIRNLQQKFHRNIDDWLKMAFGQEGLAESVFRLKLRELAELLEPLGIKLADPAEPLRDHKDPL